MNKLWRTTLSLLLITLLTVSGLTAACAKGSDNPMLPPVLGERTEDSPPATEGVMQPVAADAPPVQAETAAPTNPTAAPETEATPTPEPTPEPTEARREQPDDVQGEVAFNQGVMILNGRMIELFGISESAIEAYADRLNLLNRQMPAGTRLASMMVPTSGEFYTPAEYHTGMHSQFDAIEMIYGHLDPEVVRVDAYDEILQHSDEYVYFRTDHHWTGLGAYYGYVAACKALGLTVPSLDQYDEYELEGGYLGSLSRFAEDDPSVVNYPDTVYVYRPQDYAAEAVYYDDLSMEGGYYMHLFATEFAGSEKYLSFSGGDAPLLVIESQMANSGRKAMVIKDSYANAMVPHLAQNYDVIYIIDPRAVSGSLVSFIVDHGIDDVIVLNYAFAYANPSWNAGFEALIGY